MSYLPEHLAIAENLTAATCAGSLVDAYAALKGHPPASIVSAALICGYSCIATRNQRKSLNHILAQVSEATRRRTDGFGLRATAH
ncbi:hypothetical protein [Stenotrophomonas sp. STK17_22]|uniref:hypothetical protein n=1 Tax=Stenotrophomonas sp. STK17_22 TaxID=3455201 RepID=UPI003F81EFED